VSLYLGVFNITTTTLLTLSPHTTPWPTKILLDHLSSTTGASSLWMMSKGSYASLEWIMPWKISGRTTTWSPR
jgi:hypothetical protein